MVLAHDRLNVPPPALQHVKTGNPRTLIVLAYSFSTSGYKLGGEIMPHTPGLMKTGGRELLYVFPGSLATPRITREVSVGTFQFIGT